MTVLAIVNLETRAGQSAAFLRTMQRPLELTRANPHCSYAELFSHHADPNRYVLIEKWDSIALHQAHFEYLLAAGEVEDAMLTWNGMPQSTHYQEIP